MTAYLLKQLDYQNNTEWRVYFIFVFAIANCTVLFFTLFVGIAANVFVVWAVIRQKSLQTSNNALLVNLAIIDLIRCTVDCPLLLSIELRGYGIGHGSALLCDAQMVSFSFSCCVQLLTLANISAERYQAIANPFQNKQRRIRIMVWIPLTWTVALLLTVVCMNRPRDAPTYLKCNGIGLHTDSLPADTFGRYILIPLWSGCFSVVIGFYGRIFWIVKTHNKKIFDQGVLPPPKKKLKIAVDDGKPAEEKSNKLVEHESKKSETAKTETQKEDYPASAAAKQPADVETKDCASVVEGPLHAETAKITTSATPVNSLDTTASCTSSREVITNNNFQPSPQMEKKIASTCYSSLPVATPKQPEAIETTEYASVQEGNTETAKMTTSAIPVISLDATASSTPSLKVRTKNNCQPTPPSPKIEKKTISSSSPPVANVKQTETVETGERASVGDGMSQTETANKNTHAIHVLSLDATTSCTTSAEVIRENGRQPTPPSTKMEKKRVSFEGNASVLTVLTDLEGSTKTASVPDPKSTINVKVEEAQPLPAVEVPKTEAPPAAQDDQEVAGAVCMMPSKVSKERASKKKEGKLAKRSGYIILTFVLFWTPLIVSILVNFFAHKYDTTQVWIAMEVEILAVSVACMTSATNPITYAAVNPQFRTEFRKLKVKCKRVKKRIFKR